MSVQKYRTILADPPWNTKMTGLYRTRAFRPSMLVYDTMATADICALPVERHADIGCHLWLWCTNSHLHEGFHVMEAWGFTYLAPIHWRKPSGLGNWFVHRTQTVLFGYYKKCQFNRERYKPNIFDANPGAHSEKPDAIYQLIEKISDEPRAELFARVKRCGYDVWGNEVDNDIEL